MRSRITSVALLAFGLLLPSCGDDVVTANDAERGPYSQLALHDGYWISDGPVTVINDMPRRGCAAAA